jgi:hypothetical protein
VRDVTGRKKKRHFKLPSLLRQATILHVLRLSPSPGSRFPLSTFAVDNGVYSLYKDAISEARATPFALPLKT